MNLAAVKSEGVFCRLVGEFLVGSVYKGRPGLHAVFLGGLQNTSTVKLMEVRQAGRGSKFKVISGMNGLNVMLRSF